MSVAWVGAGIAAVGVGLQYTSSQNAAHAQSSAAGSANDLAKYEYDQSRSDQQPYRDAGYSALSRMSDLLGLSGNTSADGYGSLRKQFTGADLTSDPGYQFELAQGLKTEQNSAAARGGLYSGAEMKALSKYGTDYAGTKFNEAWNRDQAEKTAEYNHLAGVSGTGQTATNQVDAAGQNYATTAGNNLIGAGNARGAADIAGANAIGNGLNQAGAWWLRTAPGASQYSAGGNGTGGYYDPASGVTYNNPSAYTSG